MELPVTKNKIFTSSDHRMVSFLRDDVNGLSCLVVIHRGGIKEPAFGATRFLPYINIDGGLNDALKLSRAMTYKSAMAGLPYGGAKIILMRPKKFDRKKLLTTYANSIGYLTGHIVTGTDAGLTEDDLVLLKSISPKVFYGTRSFPHIYTAKGVLRGIEAMLQAIHKKDGLSNYRFAIEGLGKTGFEFLKLLYAKRPGMIYVSDYDPVRIAQAKKLFPGIEAVKNIHSVDADVFSPCAADGTITEQVVKNTKAKLIAGTANNQLVDPRLGILLQKRGIYYAPDYVINAGGVMSVADEYEHNNSSASRIEKKLRLVEQNLLKIMSESKKMNKAANLVANTLAETIIRKNHFA